jgi:hypothetical protein
MGELEKQEARKVARATRKSKGAQPENQTQTTSESPPKIETIPHTFSIGAWLLDATKDNTRVRKTVRKTTSNTPLSQTTIDEFYRKKDGNDDEETKSKRLKDNAHAEDTHAFTSRAKYDNLAETINLIDETLDVCRDDIPGSITMIVDSGASQISPIYDGPVQSERNKRSRHINIRFHALRHEAEVDFFTKQLPTPLYERARRDLDANKSYSN